MAKLLKELQNREAFGTDSIPTNSEIKYDAEETETIN